jgi:hypothetical protein
MDIHCVIIKMSQAGQQKISEVTKMVKASTVLEYVKTHLDEISAQEIGRCRKVFDKDGSFYLVENEAGECDEHGIIEYPVRYSKEHGFTCGCKSGLHGFSNVKHPSGVCKHVRWSIACSIEEAEALAAIQRKIEEERRQTEEEARKATPIEVRWNIPAWMLNAPVAPHMKKAPREL